MKRIKATITVTLTYDADPEDYDVDDDSELLEVLSKIDEEAFKDELSLLFTDDEDPEITCVFEEVR